MIANSAVIYENVELGKNVDIGDHVVIYPNVKIGDNTRIFPLSVIGKPPYAPEGILHRKLKEHYGGTTIGRNCAVGVGSVVYKEVEIGDNCLLGDYCSIREEVKIGSFCLISRFVSLNYGIVIGNHVRIFECTHITGDVVIEDGVTISAGVMTLNDKYIDGKHDQVGPHICKNAKIGMGAILLADVTVGENAFVGAGALVRKDIAPNKMAYGIPAKEYPLYDEMVDYWAEKGT